MLIPALEILICVFAVYGLYTLLFDFGSGYSEADESNITENTECSESNDEKGRHE